MHVCEWLTGKSAVFGRNSIFFPTRQCLELEKDKEKYSVVLNTHVHVI